MKIVLPLCHVTVAAVILVSCSSFKRSPQKSTEQRQLSSLMESAELKDDDIFEATPPTGEYTHELAEATADDVVITQAVGNEIDDELEKTPEEEVPYARDFLAHKKTKRMQFWIEYFTRKQRERFQRFINNGEEYRHHIEKILVEHGLPKELYYVGLIESGYYLGAKSHASAVGPWQFIKGTGKRYGLKITSEIDERQDLFKASRAAAMYFKDLHNIFSSWELALAAYNAGEYGIIRRILKYGTRDFYQLSKNKQLPSETINYVPKVLAAMHVVQNAEKYGFVIPKKKQRLFDLTELKPIKKNISLKAVASRLNVKVALLKKLNPELKRYATPRYFAGTYYLRVPRTRYDHRLAGVQQPNAPEFKNAVVKTDITHAQNVLSGTAPAPTFKSRRPASKPSYHVVRRGETLISISRKYKTTPLNLARANNFKTWKTRVRIGQRLSLTADETQDVSTRQAAMPRVKVTNKPIVYKVKPGDNLTDLAKVFDTKVSKIKKVNKLKRGRILVGQKLVLPKSQKGIYTVKRGDHLTLLSRKFKQPIEALVKMNSLKRKTIYPGQKLIVNID